MLEYLKAYWCKYKKKEIKNLKKKKKVFMHLTFI